MANRRPDPSDLPPARCTRSQTLSAIKPKKAALVKKVAPAKKAAPANKAAPAKKTTAAKKPAPSKKRARQDDEQDEEADNRPKKKTRSARTKPTPLPTTRQTRSQRKLAPQAGNPQPESEQASVKATKTPRKSKKRPREDDDAEEETPAKRRSPGPPAKNTPPPQRTPTPSKPATPSPGKAGSPKKADEVSPTRSGARHSSSDLSPPPDEDVWDEDPVAEPAASESPNSEDEEDGDSDDDGDDDSSDGDDDEDEDEEEKEWPETEDEEPSDPDSSDGEASADGEDYYQYFAPRGALYCEECFDKDAKKYFLARRLAEIEIDDSEFNKTVRAGLARLEDPAVSAAHANRHIYDDNFWSFDQTLSEVADGVALSEDDAQWIADKMATEDANRANKASRLWNEHDAGPREGGRRFPPQRGHPRPVQVQVPPGRGVLQYFADREALNKRTLAELKTMDVRRLRYSIHKDFGHPMGYESGGVCLAVEPCGTGPFLIFIGVDGRVPLPARPGLTTLKWLATLRNHEPTLGSNLVDYGNGSRS